MGLGRLESAHEKQIPFGNDRQKGKSKGGSNGTFALHPTDEDLSAGTPVRSG